MKTCLYELMQDFAQFYFNEVVEIVSARTVVMDLQVDVLFSNFISSVCTETQSRSTSFPHYLDKTL